MMFLTAATMFLAASAGAGATSTAAAPIILEGAVQQVDVESHQADLRLRGSIPLPQDAAAALSFADADEDPQDDVYADGLGSIPSLKSAEGTSSWYLSVANQVYACSDNCSNVELKQRDYKEANPSKCQWQMGESNSIKNVGCNKVMDIYDNRCKRGQEIILYTHNAKARNQKWTKRDMDFSKVNRSIWFQTKGIWCNRSIVNQGTKLMLSADFDSPDRYLRQEFV
eukprot:CAMPEP_0181079742 /NCGR_PEP_ID=MMETSP1071-20121207/2191_1 /TAXON_ID=35127 /ORGANISM="Thalassiosira sp., Strain NH16" /LENGTH=225 /DNA_ID=CAMNT_0023161163 /DNA_START=77 /DNA_END=754 /DNA_ORIENTATION=+